jgi:hypothetical protein
MSRSYNTSPSYVKEKTVPGKFIHQFHHHGLFGTPVYKNEQVLDDEGNLVFEEKETIYVKLVRTIKRGEEQDLPDCFSIDEYGDNYFRVFKNVRKVHRVPVMEKVIIGYYADQCNIGETPLSPSQEEEIGVFQPCSRYSYTAWYGNRKNGRNREIRRTEHRRARRTNSNSLQIISKRYALGYDEDDNFEPEAIIVKADKAMFW